MRWDSFLYFFIVGGILFLIGFLVPWIKDHSWKKREDRLTVIYIMVGLVFYFVGYLIWQLYAMGVI